MNNTLPHPKLFADKLLEYLEKRIEDSNIKQFSDEDLLTLHSVYGAVFQRALDVLEKHLIIETYRTAEKSRVLIEIKGENDRCYRIFPRLNYCPCRAFRHQVIEKKCQITCKHVLVGRIAGILDVIRQSIQLRLMSSCGIKTKSSKGKTVDREVTQEQYLMLVQSMFDTE